ncbi:hypothetical protein AAFF_G00230840 [Aldrovandia affinis]|uniref:FAM124 domain-containing protein n=1 Tax=Aldrovandia affinis TaxID=143900 RepID=A0AAD7RFC3_9TELE|nr:hypothetical protein AAFF_G00230840 [Aldrovandia affinis]
MEKISAEDDCVDSGAETAGSDCSPMSSGSSELSVGSLQDPFLVSVHIIAEPGRSKPLQQAADALLSCVHRELRLVCVSEHGAWGPRPKPRPPPRPRPAQPALTVTLLVREGLQRLHRALQSPPWRYHPAEWVSTGPGGQDRLTLDPRGQGGLTVGPRGQGGLTLDPRGQGGFSLGQDRLTMGPRGQDGFTRGQDGFSLGPRGQDGLTLDPRGQDGFSLDPGGQDGFPRGQGGFTLGPGTPLWAVGPALSAWATVRFTVFCRHHTFPDAVRLYGLLLRRPLARRRDDSCLYAVYSNPGTEVQLCLRRLPRGRDPGPAHAALVEFRVRDVGALVPLLPRPCTPLSERRWQTEDYDGNKILLQVRGSAHCRRRHTIGQFDDLLVNSSPCTPDPAPAPYMGVAPPPTEPAAPAAPPTARGSRTRRPSQTCPRPVRRTQRPPGSGGLAPGLALCSAPPPAPPPPPPSPALAPPFRLNVDALVGAVETDVDTGKMVDSGAVDFSVVSAYSRPRPRPRPCPALSAPPRDPHASYQGLSHPACPAPLRKSHSISATPSFRPGPGPTVTVSPSPWETAGAGIFCVRKGTQSHDSQHRRQSARAALWVQTARLASGCYAIERES